MDIRPEQIAQLRQATDSLAALTQQVHQLSTRRHCTTNAAILVSGESEQHLRETERIMARLRPHLDRAEQQFMERLERVDLCREAQQDGKAETSESRTTRLGVAESRHIPVKEERTISGRVNDQVGSVQMDPSDPTWVKRTVFVKDIEIASANAQTVKDVCARVGSEGDPADLIVSVSLRRKTELQKGSWALVSFATERGATKLLEEQRRKVVFRLTGKQWIFLPYQPQKLESHQARARKFQSAESAKRWTKTGLVGHAIASMKRSRESTKHKRTVWVGGVPDHLARGGRDQFEQNMKRIFSEYGTIEELETRYKDVHAGSGGASWCTVTFTSPTVASDVLAQRICVAAHDLGFRADRMVELKLRSADARVEVSPIGKATVQRHIDAIHRAIDTYTGYLPSSHPTLIRMHVALAALHRRCGDEDAAAYSEQEARRLAKNTLLEIERVGDWAVYTEDESLMRELLKGDKQVEDSLRRRRDMAQHETPTRQWADG